jgi:membrane-bound metal-dependent hydrolase YbcI (DUF457 family)
VLLDLVWPLFVLAGLEVVRVAPGATAFTPLDFVHYPWTHSLLAAAGWAALVAAVGYALRRDGRAALVLGAAVVSHWVLDLVAHRPDLPLVPGGARHGLGLWNSVPATVGVEAALFLGAVYVYAAFTRPLDRTGAVALWAFVGFAGAVCAASALGPPPPDGRAVAWAGLAQWLWIPWGAWIDRHRVPRADATLLPNPV